MALGDLDLTDRKILAELDKNARISYSELGKKIRVAKETVKYRVRSLEKQGIITGYYTVLNFSKLGITLHRLYIRLQNASPGVEKEIISYLINSKQVAVFYRVNGPFHLALGIWAKNIWDYEKFWHGFKSEFGPYLTGYQTHLMTNYNEFSRSYLLPPGSEKKTFSTISETKTENLDKRDLALLRHLSNNSRASLVDIAKKLGTSVVTVRYHLKRLISRQVIVGFRVMLDLTKLGKEYYKVDLWLNKFSNSDKILSHIISNYSVTYSERSLITGDMEFDVEVNNFNEFTRLMDSFKRNFPEDIKDYTYYSRIENYKTNYFPVV